MTFLIRTGCFLWPESSLNEVRGLSSNILNTIVAKLCMRLKAYLFTEMLIAGQPTGRAAVFSVSFQTDLRHPINHLEEVYILIFICLLQSLIWAMTSDSDVPCRTLACVTGAAVGGSDSWPIFIVLLFMVELIGVTVAMGPRIRRL